MGTTPPKLRPDEWPTALETELEMYRKVTGHNSLVAKRLLSVTILFSIAAVVISIIAMTSNG